MALVQLEPRYNILVADNESWKVAFTKNVFGFSEKRKGFWKNSKEGDLLVFYVTSPFKKVIGFGKITEKYIDDEVFWPDEKFFKRSLWRYHIRFNVIYLLEDWEKGITIPYKIMLNSSIKVIQKENFRILLRKAEDIWKTNLEIPF